MLQAIWLRPWVCESREVTMPDMSGPVQRRMKKFHVVVVVAVITGLLFMHAPRLFCSSMAMDPREQNDLTVGVYVDEDLAALPPDSRSLSNESSANSPVTSQTGSQYAIPGENRGSLATETLEIRSKAGSDEKDGGDSNNCGAALLQGLRISQEDRILCMADIILPPYGGMPETKVSLFAVFDGHGGDEASHLSSKELHRRFLHHLYASDVTSRMPTSPSSQSPELPSTGSESGPTRDSSGDAKLVGQKRRSIHVQESISVRNNPPSETDETITAVEFFENSALGNVLKEALSKAISDIESTFSAEALRMRLQAGTTACVVLQAGNHLLVANLGDSKALLCPTAACSPARDSTTSEFLGNRRREILKRRSKRMRERDSSVGVCGDGPPVLELTRDHRPDREEEKLRVEAAGGFVESYGGLPRVNGQLAISRSIGDMAFKKYGVTADPEWTGWLNIGSTESHLIIASDGVFEKLTTREVCGVLSAVKSGIDVSVALGLAPQVREPPIALPPRKQPGHEQPVKETQPSRAIMAVPHFNTGLWPAQLPDTELKDLRGALQETDEKGQTGLDLIEEPILENGDKDFGTKMCQIQANNNPYAHSSRSGKFDSGSEVAPLRPENPARVFAKAVVDAAFKSGSKDNLAAIVVPLHPGAIHASDRSLQEPVKKTSAAHIMPEAVKNSSPSLFDMTGSLKNGQPTEDQVFLISGMMVKGFGNGDCYELIDTVLGSSILPWRPVVEYDLTQESTEAVKPVVERLPSNVANAGVAGGQLEVYREHLICTPRFALEGGHKEVCLPPEGLARFLELIASIPLDKQRLLPKHWDTEGRPGDPNIVPPYSVNHHRYMLQKNFARGAFGEIWLAVQRPCLKEEGESTDFPTMHNASQRRNFTQCQDTGSIPGGQGWAVGGHFSYGGTFILKRVMVEKGGNAYLSGLREKHFGQIFLNESLDAKPTNCPHDQISTTSSTCANPKTSYWKAYCKFNKALGFYSVANVSSPMEDNAAGLAHIARYVESFEVPGKEEFWLVFQNEGKSLSSLLYTAGVNPEDAGDLKGLKVVQPSPWWRWLKRTDAGRAEMRSIIHQLLLAVKACHDRNITHRDIKPENIVVSTDRSHVSDWPSNLTVRIIDFGSAIDEFTLKHLYGSLGPSQAEQTTEYAPPEATLSKHWLHFHVDQARVYDMWSVGIVMLELVLGTPHVFQISARTQILLNRQLEGMDESARQTIYMLRAYLEMCILLPGIPPQHHHHHQSDTVEQSEEVRLAAWKCTEESVMQHIRQRDPLGIGMPDVWALRLLRQLLQWYPEDRISAAEALHHPYFHPSLQG